MWPRQLLGYRYLKDPKLVESFSKMHADVAIMSSGGITLEGVTNSHGLLVDIQRAMINAFERVIFCLDHTKFGRKSMYFLCELDCIGVIVTNHGAPKELVTGLRGKRFGGYRGRQVGGIGMNKGPVFWSESLESKLARWRCSRDVSVNSCKKYNAKLAQHI